MGAVNRRKWFIRFLGRSIGQRKGRVAVAALSVMIASAIVVSALGVSLGIRKKLGGELKAYGANVVVSPKGGGYLDENVLSLLEGEAGVEDFTGQLYAPVRVNGAVVELMGLDMRRIRERGWKVSGRWPSGPEETLLGADIRDALGLSPEDSVTLGVGEGAMKRGMRVAGFVETGGPEDGAVLLELRAAQELTGLEGKLGAVLLRVDTEGIEATVAAMRGRLEGMEVKTLRQVAYAEEAFLGKMQLLMALVTLVVIFSTSISVASTMSATVLERMREIGLMKALGGTKKDIGGFYMAEGIIIGLSGGMVGYVLGFLSAQAVSRGAFNSFIDVPLYLLPASLALGSLLAVSASLAPLADALRRSPSTVLREE
jgi:putative ABC transport system permease protein